MNYSFSYKKELPLDMPWNDFFSCDLFISAYNSSERVQTVFEKVSAGKKYWIVFPEYKYKDNELPAGNKFVCPPEQGEGEQIIGFFDHLDEKLVDISISIDITGFMRPQLAYLIKYLHFKEVKVINLVYSEPIQYSKKEETTFSDGVAYEVRQIAGFEGSHPSETSNDLLIIGSGYDHNLIKTVCNHKEHAKIKQLIGFPSLRPDMYQENIIKASQASDSIEPEALMKPLFAPAHDPFIAAEVLSDTVKYLDKKNSEELNKGYSNLYLCPLSTKPHTVGFVLFFLKEMQGKPVSLIYPFFNEYEKETSIGINRVWQYTVEFD